MLDSSSNFDFFGPGDGKTGDCAPADRWAPGEITGFVCVRKVLLALGTTGIGLKWLSWANCLLRLELPVLLYEPF